jgi:putative photosynthetic complex assembly protein
MSSTQAREIFPTKPCAAIALGLGAVVLLLGGLRLAGMQPVRVEPDTPPEAILGLKVEDAAQGVVIVRNAATGEMIQTFRSAEGAFVRATLRALVNDRRRKGTKIEGDFRLERHASGQLYLIDGVTGKRLTLNAYGPDNSAVFAAFMSNQKGEGQ